MAYQIKRSERVREELELIDENGNAAHKLVIDLDAVTMVKQVSRKYLDLVNAQKSILNMDMEDKEEALEVLGRTVLDLLETVFGEENTRIIIEFYQEDYMEMCQQVLPFVVDVVIPKIRSTAQEARNNTLKGYKDKQSKRFGIKK